MVLDTGHGSQPHCFSDQYFDIECIKLVYDDSASLKSKGSEHDVDAEPVMSCTQGNAAYEVELGVPGCGLNT